MSSPRLRCTAGENASGLPANPHKEANGKTGYIHLPTTVYNHILHCIFFTLQMGLCQDLPCGQLIPSIPLSPDSIPLSGFSCPQ